MAHDFHTFRFGFFFFFEFSTTKSFWEASLSSIKDIYAVGFPIQTDFEKEFQKRIVSEFDLSAVISSLRERKSTCNKAQSFGRKAKGFFRLKLH